MRSRDAENLIADILTGGSKDTDPENQISESVLLGMRRSQPIYERKIKEKDSIAKQRRYYFYRGILMGITYPVRVLARILRS